MRKGTRSRTRNKESIYEVAGYGMHLMDRNSNGITAGIRINPQPSIRLTGKKH